MKSYKRKCRPGNVQRAVKRNTGATPFFSGLNTSAGNHLSKEHHDFFGARMNIDTTGVLLHYGSNDHLLAEAYNARAFTYGNDIFFNKNEYAPGTAEGDKLLAHELTHVVQGSAMLARKPKTDLPKLTPAQIKKNKEDIKSRDLFWKDMSDHFEKDIRKLAGSNNDDSVDYLSTSFKEGPEIKDGIETIFAAPIVSVGSKYLAETDVDKRKAWIKAALDKIDAWRFEKFRLDDLDLENSAVTSKLSALSYEDKLAYIQKLGERSKIVANESVKEAIRKMMPSTPKGSGAVMDSAGGFIYTFGNITIQVLPDIFNAAKVKENSGETSIQPKSGNTFPATPAYNWDAKQQITSVNPVPRPVFPVWQVQTSYGKKTDPSRAPGYGYGTRSGDSPASGTKSLRFHEGSHGQVFIDEIRNKWAATPYPSFTGKKGDSKDVFETKLNAWVTARDAFKKMLGEAVNKSLHEVDCAGKSIVKYYSEIGEVTEVTCP